MNQTSQETSPNENGKISWLIWLIPASVVFLVFAAWWLTPAFVQFQVSQTKIDNAGVYGDQFGAVNALFSGLAFGGVIIAIILQTQELRLQRQELQATRNELRGSKEQLERQAQLLLKQNFEATFFQMIRLHHDIVGATNFKGKFGGRRTFETLYKRYESHRRHRERDSNLDQRNWLDLVFGEFYQQNDALLGHYFRNLYRILKFVDQANMVDQKFYSGVLRAQLSNDELALIFYNAISTYGREKMLPLARKFALFENLDHKKLVDVDDAQSASAEAFGDQVVPNL